MASFSKSHYTLHTQHNANTHETDKRTQFNTIFVLFLILSFFRGVLILTQGIFNDNITHFIASVSNSHCTLHVHYAYTEHSIHCTIAYTTHLHTLHSLHAADTVHRIH